MPAPALQTCSDGDGNAPCCRDGSCVWHADCKEASCRYGGPLRPTLWEELEALRIGPRTAAAAGTSRCTLAAIGAYGERAVRRAAVGSGIGYGAAAPELCCGSVSCGEDGRPLALGGERPVADGRHTRQTECL